MAAASYQKLDIQILSLATFIPFFINIVIMIILRKKHKDHLKMICGIDSLGMLGTSL